MWVNALIWCIKWPSNPASAQHPCLFGGGAGRRLLSFQMFHFVCLPCLDFCLPQPLSYNRNIAAVLRCGKKYYPRWNEQTERVVCHFFSFTSSTRLPATPFKKAKTSHSFILNKEAPTGFCHWDEKPKLRHSLLSNREPFKSSDNERDR